MLSSLGSYTFEQTVQSNFSSRQNCQSRASSKMQKIGMEGPPHRNLQTSLAPYFIAPLLCRFSCTVCLHKASKSEPDEVVVPILSLLFYWQVLQSRNFLRANKLLGSFKLDVATAWSQPGTLCHTLVRCV